MVTEANCSSYGRRKSYGVNKEKTEDNIESKKHKREKRAVHTVTREPAIKSVVWYGPHRVRTGVKYPLRREEKL